MPFDPKLRICPDCKGPKSHDAKRCARCAGLPATTPEARSKRALCGAKKKNGERCRAYAGQGTETPGIGRCKFHLGATKNHRQHALNIEVSRRMVTFGEPIQDVSAPEVLIRLMQASSGYVAWLSEEVAAINDHSEAEAQVLVRLYSEERVRLLRVSEACVRAGVAEQYVRVTERQTQDAAAVVRQAALDVGLSHKQVAALGKAIMLRQSGVDADDGEFIDVAGRFRAEEDRRVRAVAEARARELTGLVDAFPPDELLPENAA